MPTQRIFLNSREYLPDAVSRRLIPAGQAGTFCDLQHLLVVVPTRQAGRRLREALARQADRDQQALSPPLIATPAFFLNSEATSAMVETATWIQLLTALDLRDFSVLFPRPPTEQDFQWALHITRLLQQLRANLLDEGLTIRQTAGRLAASAHLESPRWRELAELETRYLNLLAANHGRDPCTTALEAARNPALPGHITGMVLAGVPDPAPLALQAIEKLASKYPLDILIHADEAEQSTFDEWGRPRPEEWNHRRTLEWPEAATSLHLGSDPEELAVEIAACRRLSGFATTDTAVGVLNPEITPHLINLFEGEEICAFDPAGIPASRHAVFHLLSLLGEWLSSESRSAWDDWFRHPDILAWYQHRHNLAASDILRQLDHIGETYLPADTQGLQECIARHSEKNRKANGAFPCDALREALRIALKARRQLLTGAPPTGALRDFLQEIYAHRRLDPDEPADRAFAEVASIVSRTLDDTLHPACALLPMADLLLLLTHLLAAERWFPEPEGAGIDLEGWLELPWNTAPLLLLGGMNEEFLPGEKHGDIFLPESLRRELGMRTSAFRYGRDLYLLHTLLAVRHANGGRVESFTGKTSGNNEPLKPSRLLFHCGNTELLRRTRILFSKPPAGKAAAAINAGLRLDVRPPPDTRPEALVPDHLSATAFKDYLACPFQFYLKHILKMQPCTPDQRELDAKTFGTLMHAGMQRLGEDDLKDCTDKDLIAAETIQAAGNWLDNQFGKHRPLVMDLQWESAKQRLRAAAARQADRAREGWTIVAVEKSMTMEWNRLTIRARIDRVDHHPEHGYCVVDYKTADSASPATNSHYTALRTDTRESYLPAACFEITEDGKTKAYAWKDLQLPLYILLCIANGYSSANNTCQAAYFSLPKAVADTGIDLLRLETPWLDAARTTVNLVVNAIQDAAYWPPAPTQEVFPEFAMLFPDNMRDPITSRVNGREFEEYLLNFRKRGGGPA